MSLTPLTHGRLPPADDALFEAIRDSGRDVRRVGDSIAPRSIEAVIYEAEQLARAV